MGEKHWRPGVGDDVCYADRPNEPYRVREVGWSSGTCLIDPLVQSWSRPSHWAYSGNLEKYKGELGSWDQETI